MAGELEQAPSQKRIPSKVESLLRAVNPFERKKKEEKEFQEALRVTIAKLLEDIKKGGFVYKPSDEYGDEEFYSVSIKGKNNKIFLVSFILEFNQEKLVNDFTLNAAETQFSAGFRRSLHFSGARFDSTVPFFSPEWTGAYLLTLERIPESRESRTEQLKRKESLGFLKELFLAQVDVEETRKAFYQSGKEGEKGGVFWVHSSQNLLLSKF